MRNPQRIHPIFALIDLWWAEEHYCLYKNLSYEYMSLYKDVTAKVEDFDLVLVIEAKVHRFQEFVYFRWPQVEKTHYNQLH